MSIVRRFGRTLGLTAERRIELSDIVEEDARVSTRFERGYSMVPSMHPSGGLFATEGYRVSDRHLVTFSTGTVSITVDDPKYFTELSNGEKVRVAYRTRTEVVEDYLDDFREKAEVARRAAGHEIVSVERTAS